MRRAAEDDTYLQVDERYGDLLRDGHELELQTLARRKAKSAKSAKSDSKSVKSGENAKSTKSAKSVKSAKSKPDSNSASAPHESQESGSET